MTMNENNNDNDQSDSDTGEVNNSNDNDNMRVLRIIMTMIKQSLSYIKNSNDQSLSMLNQTISKQK